MVEQYFIHDITVNDNNHNIDGNRLVTVEYDHM